MYIYIHMYVYTYTHTHVYIYTYVCVYIHTHTYIYIYVYIHTHTRSGCLVRRHVLLMSAMFSLLGVVAICRALQCWTVCSPGFLWSAATKTFRFAAGILGSCVDPWKNGFGSICYRPGFVHVRVRFLRFLVDFGSVHFGVWNILHWFFFCPASEKQIQIASRTRFIASRKRFHEQRLSKSGESWTRKTKASWNCQCMQFIMKKPIFAFFIELKKQLQLFQSVYWGRVRRFRFLQFGSVLHTVPAVHGSCGL